MRDAGGQSGVRALSLGGTPPAFARRRPCAPVVRGLLWVRALLRDAARRALDAVRRALEALETGMTPDAVLTDAEEALDALGELTGRTAKEEIVSRIFSRFCVGK